MSNQKSFAYFGTPYVSRDTLALLVEAGYVPSVVVTSPDAPKGRGLALMPSETKEWALAHGIPVLTPQKLTPEVFAEIAAYGVEYAIVVAYGKILPKSFIESFPLGIYNIHYSLLPKYRGASPVEAVLLNDDPVTGVSVQRMAYELDAGDVIGSMETPIGPLETIRELRPRLIKIGAELLVSLLPRIEAGGIAGTPQDHSLATHSGKIRKEEGELAIPGNDTLNWRKYRAYAEGPGTYFYTERNGKRVRVKIVSASMQDGRFVIERVIPEGKKEMDYADFIR